MRCILLFLLLCFHMEGTASSLLLNSDFSSEKFKISIPEVTPAPGESSEASQSWQLSVEVGGAFTSGNTDTQTLKGKLSGGLDYLGGRLSYLAQFYQKTVDKQRSADQWKLGIKHNMYFGEHSSSFVVLEQASDKLGITPLTTTFAAGYTQRLYDNHQLLWDADIGPGIVWTEHDLGKQVLKIIHIGSKFKYNLTQKTQFEQVLVADVSVKSKDNDVYRSETSLLASVVENLKMKVSYALKFESQVTSDKEKLDTETSISLVYIF